MSLMMFASPQSWGRLAAADRLIDAMQDAVADCKAAAAEDAREQKSTIIGAAPEKVP